MPARSAGRAPASPPSSASPGTRGRPRPRARLEVVGRGPRRRCAPRRSASAPALLARQQEHEPAARHLIVGVMLEMLAIELDRLRRAAQALVDPALQEAACPGRSGFSVGRLRAALRRRRSKRPRRASRRGELEPGLAVVLVEPRRRGGRPRATRSTRSRRSATRASVRTYSTWVESARAAASSDSSASASRPRLNSAAPSQPQARGRRGGRARARDRRTRASARRRPSCADSSLDAAGDGAARGSSEQGADSTRRAPRGTSPRSSSRRPWA